MSPGDTLDTSHRAPDNPDHDHPLGQTSEETSPEEHMMHLAGITTHHAVRSGPVRTIIMVMEFDLPRPTPDKSNSMMSRECFEEAWSRYMVPSTAMRTLITSDDSSDTDQPHVSELEVSAVCSVNNNNEMDALEKRRSFADMKMVNVTNSNYHSQV